jgi:hypothetical protein
MLTRLHNVWLLCAVESLDSVAQKRSTSRHDARKEVDAAAIHKSSHATKASSHAASVAMKEEHEPEDSRREDRASSSKIAAPEEEKASLQAPTTKHTGTGILSSVELAVQDLTRCVHGLCACFMLPNLLFVSL